jgi:hypothetical protein
LGDAVLKFGTIAQSYAKNRAAPAVDLHPYRSGVCLARCKCQILADTTVTLAAHAEMGLSLFIVFATNMPARVSG